MNAMIIRSLGNSKFIVKIYHEQIQRIFCFFCFKAKFRLQRRRKAVHFQLRRGKEESMYCHLGIIWELM